MRQSDWKEIFISWGGINISNVDNYCKGEVLEDQKCSINSTIDEKDAFYNLSYYGFKCGFHKEHPKDSKYIGCVNYWRENDCKKEP
jgi:hypothetical protein